MKVDVSSKEVEANEAINIKIKISGKGNLPLIDHPEFVFPSDFETYDPKINEKIKADDSIWTVLGEDCPLGTSVKVVEVDGTLFKVNIIH